MIYADVEGGKFRIKNDGPWRVFDLTDKGQAALAELLKEWGYESVMCSSSVDWAEEYGAPEGFDVRDWLHGAQRMAAGPPQIAFTVDQLKRIVKRLRNGDIQSLIEAFEREIAEAER